MTEAERLAAAIDHLPKYARLEKVGDHWRVMLYATQEDLDYAFAMDLKWHTAMTRDSLTEAVEAATGRR